jgi:hypothetical protein
MKLKNTISVVVSNMLAILLFVSCSQDDNSTGKSKISNAKPPPVQQINQSHNLIINNYTPFYYSFKLVCVGDPNQTGVNSNVILTQNMLVPPGIYTLHDFTSAYTLGISHDGDNWNGSIDGVPFTSPIHGGVANANYGSFYPSTTIPYANWGFIKASFVEGAVQDVNSVNINFHGGEGGGFSFTNNLLIGYGIEAFQNNTKIDLNDYYITYGTPVAGTLIIETELNPDPNSSDIEIKFTNPTVVN